MTQNHYVKYGTLSGLLLICTIFLNTAEDNPRLALAQITPAPEKFGSTEDSSTDSSPDTVTVTTKMRDQLAHLVLMVMMSQKIHHQTMKPQRRIRLKYPI